MFNPSYNSDNVYASMSIASFGPSTLPKPSAKPFAIKDTNACHDIEGAAPAETKIWAKPNFFQTGDVDGARSKSLYPRRMESNALKVDDIDGAQAKIRDKMLLTKRVTNPLSPSYVLPSFAEAPAPEPKFIKDSLFCRDIEGSAPTKPKVFATRDFYSVNDIVGAQANYRPRHAKVRLEAEPYPIMDVSDICSKNSTTHRNSDPVDPKYYIHGEIVEDNPRYSKPKPLPHYIADNHLLTTHDIDGAFPGWKPEHRPERREFKNTNITTDIEGAQADSTKHSIVTNRITNPLLPVYVSLDGDYLHNPVEPLLPSTLIKPKLSQNKLHPTAVQESPASSRNLSPATSETVFQKTDYASAEPQLLSSRQQEYGYVQKDSGRRSNGGSVPTSSRSASGVPVASSSASLNSNRASPRLSNSGNNILSASPMSNSQAYFDKYTNSQYQIVPQSKGIAEPSSKPNSNPVSARAVNFKPPSGRDVPALNFARVSA